jgi:carbonic anhydrase/acetyltransferase-like protein (isoleucine patch superfamily)
MPVYPFQGHIPRLGHRVFLAPDAHVAGDVELGDDVSFWFHTVARGDVNFIRIGARTNIQDGAVLHVNHGTHPLVIGEGVVVGHQAVVHGCTVENGALIGIGARVLDGAVVERGAQIGAGAVVAPGHRIPAGHLALGIPARVVRPLTDEEARRIVDGCERYVELKEIYREILGSGTGTGPGFHL